MSDYHQPEFYRFNEDSLLLVSEIIRENPASRKILDVGAGSGIIGIELALKLGASETHFLELQKEWLDYLTSNLEKYLKDRRTHIFWSSVGEWSSDFRYDLIVGNPPYYLPGKGRMSPDPIRSKCRMFLQDSWKILLEKSAAHLTPEGSAWFVTLKENQNYIEKMAAHLKPEFLERGELIIVRIKSPE